MNAKQKLARPVPQVNWDGFNDMTLRSDGINHDGSSWLSVISTGGVNAGTLCSRDGATDQVIIIGNNGEDRITIHLNCTQVGYLYIVVVYVPVDSPIKTGSRRVSWRDDPKGERQTDAINALIRMVVRFAELPEDEL